MRIYTRQTPQCFHQQVHVSAGRTQGSTENLQRSWRDVVIRGFSSALHVGPRSPSEEPGQIMELHLETNVPSLVELCVQTAIDNIRYISDVGETDLYLLKDILPHCTVDQLMHIEKSSEGRDLSPVTDDLWKRFYEQHFGEDDLKLVIKRLKQYKAHKSAIKWSVLYEAKLKKRNDDQKRSAERLKELYKKETERKQSRQVQICSKIPPSSKKRSFSGGTGSGNRFSNVKGNLMKKAKLEFLNSYEVKVQEAMRRKAIQKNKFSPSSVSRTMKLNAFPGCGSASSSKMTKPLSRP